MNILVENNVDVTQRLPSSRRTETQVNIPPFSNNNIRRNPNSFIIWIDYLQPKKRFPPMADGDVLVREFSGLPRSHHSHLRSKRNAEGNNAERTTRPVKHQ